MSGFVAAGTVVFIREVESEGDSERDTEGCVEFKRMLCTMGGGGSEKRTRGRRDGVGGEFSLEGCDLRDGERESEYGCGGRSVRG